MSLGHLSNDRCALLHLAAGRNIIYAVRFTNAFINILCYVKYRMVADGFPSKAFCHSQGLPIVHTAKRFLHAKAVANAYI